MVRSAEDGTSDNASCRVGGACVVAVHVCGKGCLRIAGIFGLAVAFFLEPVTYIPIKRFRRLRLCRHISENVVRP